jgi:hypothetical protein
MCEWPMMCITFRGLAGLVCSARRMRGLDSAAVAAAL